MIEALEAVLACIGGTIVIFAVFGAAIVWIVEGRPW